MAPHIRWFIAAALSACLLSTEAANAAEWHIVTAGTPAGADTETASWDIRTALGQPAAVKPGDVVWIHGGQYSGPVQGLLRGTADRPIIVRAVPGERVVIRGRLELGCAAPGEHVWYWGLEVVTQGRSEGAADAVVISNAERTNPGIRLINCILHDCAGGVATWAGAADSEVYGCLIYNNGYDIPGDARGHGHGLYIQSRTGPKLIKDNIIFRNFDKGAQLYGKAAPLNNVTFEGNTLFNNSELALPCKRFNCDNLAIQGLGASQNARLLANMTYAPPKATQCNNSIGEAKSAGVRDNYFVAAYGHPAIAWLVNKPVPGLVMNNNTFYGKLQGFALNEYGAGNVQLRTRPAEPKVFVRPNDYEPGRANITIFNWPKAETVAIDVSSTDLRPGMPYEVRDVQNLFCKPVISGVYDGKSVSIPMVGLTVAPPEGLDPNLYPTPEHTGPEFGAFVLLADTGGANFPPRVNAGRDVTVWLPTNIVSLDARVTDDCLPTDSRITHTWSKQSGLGTVTFADANAIDTTATFSTVGTYVLRLTAGDTDLSAHDEVTVVVNPPRQNAAPRVEAGPDRRAVWPATTVGLHGAVVDDELPAGATVNQTWSQASGPGTVSFADPHAASTAATFSTTGTYVLRLTAGDSALTGSDDVTVAIHPADAAAYLESKGMVVIEAEGYHGVYDGTDTLAGHYWIEATDRPDYSGAGAMLTVPSVRQSAGSATTGPRMDYQVKFATAGTYHVWTRLCGPDQNDNSIHVGLDGIGASLRGGGLDEPNASDQWVWVKAAEGTPVTVTVGKPGVHTVNVWMREDGTYIDKILLTADADYVPGGAGPDASPRVGQD